MGISDLFMFPFYVIFFALLFYWRRKKITDPLLRKYQFWGFWAKVAGSIGYIIFSVYISQGDSTFLYYPEGINITKLILKDFANIELLFMPGTEFDENLLADSFNKGYFASESNYLVTKLVSFLSFVTFGSYAAITLWFSMISFSGVWRLFKFFYELYPKLHKALAIAILFMPTFVFWSSGILKDPICTGMMGWLTYSLAELLMKRKSIFKNGLIILLSSTVLGLVKFYILAAYLPFLLLYITLWHISFIKQFFLRLALLAVITVTVAGFLYVLSDKLQEALGDLALDKIATSVKTTQANFMHLSDLAESSFTLGVEFDGSTFSLLKIAPAAIAATLFRPYLWESRKLSTLLSSLESLALMIFTLYVFLRAGPFTFVKCLVRNPMVIFCISFSLLFALFVGATTLNFGTLVRYKIPCIPFYLIALFLILDTHKKNSTAAKEKAMATEAAIAE
jgi:hypothetical protein